MPGILIIDDEATILQLFHYFFQDAGYETRTAADGRAALEVLREFRPDFMIVDISMPRMSGWEFILELNRVSLRRRELKGIPYIVMTGENFLTESKRFSFEKDGNFKGYFLKMTPPERILEFVKANLNL